MRYEVEVRTNAGEWLGTQKRYKLLGDAAPKAARADNRGCDARIVRVTGGRGARGRGSEDLRTCGGPGSIGRRSVMRPDPTRACRPPTVPPVGLQRLPALASPAAPPRAVPRGLARK